MLGNFAQQLLDAITGMIFLYLFVKNEQNNYLNELSSSIILLSNNHCHTTLLNVFCPSSPLFIISFPFSFFFILTNIAS